MRSFDPSIDLAKFGPQMLDAVESLARPAPAAAGALHESSATVAPDEPWAWTTPGDDRSGAITHRPDGGIVRVLLDGRPLVVENRGGAEFGRDGDETLILRSRHALRLLSARFRPVSLEAGEHELTIECVEPGRFGFDYVWVK